MKTCVWYGLWMPEHNNKRYTELLPRLRGVQVLYNRLSQHRLVRKIQFLAHTHVAPLVLYPRMFRQLARDYDVLFSTNINYAKWFPGPVIVDLDDPVFTPEELWHLTLPNVITVVTTTEEIKSRLMDTGVACPIHVIPQGISMTSSDSRASARIDSIYRRPGEMVVGLTQPFLLMDSEVGTHADHARQMYSVQLLLDAMEVVRLEAPNTVLWLIGRPGEELLRYARGRPWIRLIGLVPGEETLHYTACFDIGVYPRTTDLKGRASIKLVEYMACGVPTVATNVSEAQIVHRRAVGVVADATPVAFAQGILTLVRNPELRKEISDRARVVARDHNWDELARRYQQEIIGPVLGT